MSTKLGRNVVLCLVLGLTIGGSAEAAQLVWNQTTGAAGWGTRRYFPCVSYEGRMWIFGGNTDEGYRNDVWHSINGATWTQLTAAAPWPRRSHGVSVVFDGKLWMLGGSGQSAYLNDIWSSTDATNWTQVTSSPGWFARHGHVSQVYDGRMWVIGGFDNNNMHRNDVWYTTNGADWTRATSGAPWLARYTFAGVEYDGRLWIMGGASTAGDRNDVWFTTNGANWTAATTSAAWSQRHYHSSVTHLGRMWFMGGDSGPNNDVWFSTNGTNWTLDTAMAAWFRRSGHTSLIHDNRMWVLGGERPPNANDVWFADTDVDTDGIGDNGDNCPNNPNPGQEDADGDGFGDSCDLCPGLDDGPDCNANGVRDCLDVAGVTSDDCNGDDVPDECQTGQWSGPNGGSLTSAANWTPVGVAYAHATFRNAGPSDNRCVLNVPGETRICEVTVDATGSGKQVLEIQSGATLTTSISTTIDLGGEILLTGGGLSGAAIANTGNSLLGYGTVAADIDNGGLIAGSAGRLLDLAGQAFANENSGTLRAPIASVVLVASPAPAQHGRIEARVQGTTIFASSLNNAAGATIELLGGSLGADGLTNETGAVLSGFGMIDADVINSGTMTIFADMEIVGDLVNNGTITIQSGTLTVTGSLSGLGVIIGGFGG